MEAVRTPENVDESMTTRLVRDEPSLEKSTRLLEMSVSRRLRKKSYMCEDSGGGEAA